MDERAQEARRSRPQLLHEFRPRRDARRRRLGADDAGVFHHPFDLLVQLVAVGDHEDARVGVVLQQPLGDQHHDDALAAALGVPDDAALAPGDALLRGLHAEELVRPRHLLLAGVEDDEVADQVEQPGLVAELCQRPVEQCSGNQLRMENGELRITFCTLHSQFCILNFPFYKELLRRAGGAVTQSLRIAARQHKLRGAEETFVEDLFLIGDELPHTVSQLHRAALELNHHDGEAVDIENDVRPAFVAAFQRHLLGQREVIFLRMFPIDQVHRLVRLARGNLHRHAVAQELVGAQVGLVERDAGRIGGGLQLLQRGGDMGGRIAACRQVVAENGGLDGAVVLPLIPLAKVAVTEAIGPRLVAEQVDDAVLRLAFGAGLFRHWVSSMVFSASAVFSPRLRADEADRLPPLIPDARDGAPRTFHTPVQPKREPLHG